MSTDEVRINIVPEIELHDKKDEPMTSPPQEQVSDTTIASENSSSDEKLENGTSPPQDMPGDTRINEDRKKLFRATLHRPRLSHADIFGGGPQKTVGISEDEDYPLHVAVKENYSSCLCELVDLMQSDELAIENRSGNTAFFIAAAMGRVEHAELMFEKNEKLPSIRGEKEMLPIHIAARGGHERMVEFLYKVQGPQEEMDSNKLFDYLRINENIKKMHIAALRNDWNTTIRDGFKEDQGNIPLYLTTRISDNHDIALHVVVAVAAESAIFVQELVNKMEKKDLAIQNCDGYTAFFLAAASGRVELVKLMFGKNTELPSIRGHDEKLPIHIVAQGGHKEMVTYLYGVTKDKLTEDDLIELLPDLIARVDLVDVALNFLDEYRSLATVDLYYRTWHIVGTALDILARTPMMSPDSAYQIQQGILKRCFNLY